MTFKIRMGIPEMLALWENLRKKKENGSISKPDLLIYKKWGKALSLLANNPHHPSLKTHEISDLTRSKLLTQTKTLVTLYGC